MKTQRKKWTAAAMAAAMAVMSLTACGTKATPENLFRDMNKRASEVESLRMNMKLDMNIEAAGESVSMGMDFAMEATSDPEMSSAKGVGSVGWGGIDTSTEIETYSEKQGDEYIVYTKSENGWTVQKEDSAGMSTDIGVVSEDIAKFASQFELEKDLVQVNGEDCFQLTGTITGEFLSEFMGDDMLSSFAGLGLDEDGMADMSMPCTIEVYKDSILPARMTFDMGEALLPILGAAGLDAAECTVEMTFLDYDAVEEIVIPEEALEAAGS